LKTCRDWKEYEIQIPLKLWLQWQEDFFIGQTTPQSDLEAVRSIRVQQVTVRTEISRLQVGKPWGSSGQNTLTNQHQPGWKAKEFLGWTKKWGKRWRQERLVTTTMQLKKEIFRKISMFILGHTFWIHGIKDWSRLEGTSAGHMVQSPTQAGPSRAGCPGACPVGSSISPRMETPQLPWATYASAQSPLQVCFPAAIHKKQRRSILHYQVLYNWQYQSRKMKLDKSITVSNAIPAP